MIAKQWGINGALYCMRGEEPLYDTAIGVADANKQNLNGIHTRFAAGEITMAFTAAAALILDAQGKLNMDASLDKLVPEYVHAAEITAKELLLGQKTVPDYADYDMSFKLYQQAHKEKLGAMETFKLTWNALNGAISDEDVLNIVNKLDVVDDPENSAGRRSSYRILGMAVARAYGKSLADALNELVFAPIGMKDTGLDKEAEVTYTAKMGDESIVVGAPKLCAGEAGGVVSAYDLAHFGTALLEGKLLDEEHTDIMLAPNACGLRTLNGWYYADSGIEQAQSALYINAQYNVSVAMLANAPSAKEDADETGAESFVQRMRYEMDDVYLKAEDVQLERINDANVYSVLKLAVNEDQQEFVAGNDISLAEAAALENALPYAVTQDGVAVGFALLNADKDRGVYEIWRLMIDKRFQHKGFGTAAMKLAMAELKRMGAEKAQISVEIGNEAAIAMYQKLGFSFTGRMEYGEAYMECEL